MCIICIYVHIYIYDFWKKIIEQNPLEIVGLRFCLRFWRSVLRFCLRFLIFIVFACCLVLLLLLLLVPIDLLHPFLLQYAGSCCWLQLAIDRRWCCTASVPFAAYVCLTFCLRFCDVKTARVKPCENQGFANRNMI